METKLGAKALKLTPTATAAVESSTPSTPDPPNRPQDPQGPNVDTPLAGRAAEQADAVRAAQAFVQSGLGRLTPLSLAAAVPPLLERAAADLDHAALTGLTESLGLKLLGQPVDVAMLDRLVGLVLDFSLDHSDQPQVIEALFRGLGRACANGSDQALPPAFAGAVVKAVFSRLHPQGRGDEAKLASLTQVLAGMKWLLGAVGTDAALRKAILGPVMQAVDAAAHTGLEALLPALVQATGGVQGTRAFHSDFFEALAQDVGLHDARRAGIALVMGLVLASEADRAEPDTKATPPHRRRADLMIGQVLAAVAPLGPVPTGRIVGAFIESVIDNHIVPAPGSGSADEGRLLAKVVDAVLDWPLASCVAALVGVFSAITQSPWSARARSAETVHLASRLQQAAAHTPGRDLTALSGVGQDPLCVVFLDGLEDAERGALYAIACERCLTSDASLAGSQLTRILDLDAVPELQAALLGSLVRYAGLDLTPAMASHVRPRLVAHMAAAAAAGGAGGSLSANAALAEVLVHSAYLGEMYHWQQVSSGLSHLLRGEPAGASTAAADKELILEQARFCHREHLALTRPELPAVVREHLAPVASRLAAFNNALLHSLGVTGAQSQTPVTSSRSPSGPSPD